MDGYAANLKKRGQTPKEGRFENQLLRFGWMDGYTSSLQQERERERERWGVKKEREPPLTVRYERKRRFLSDEKQNAPVIQHPDVSRKKCFSAPPL